MHSVRVTSLTGIQKSIINDVIRLLGGTIQTVAGCGQRYLRGGGKWQPALQQSRWLVGFCLCSFPCRFSSGFPRTSLYSRSLFVIFSTTNWFALGIVFDSGNLTYRTTFLLFTLVITKVIRPLGMHWTKQSLGVDSGIWEGVEFESQQPVNNWRHVYAISQSVSTEVSIGDVGRRCIIVVYSSILLQQAD